MKIQFSKPQLLGLIDSAIGFSADKSTMPILANFLIKNTAGKFSITANNMELQATAIADLGFAEDFAITLPAKKLKDSVAALASDTFTLELEGDGAAGGKAVLKGGKAKYTLQSLPAAHYPILKRELDITSTFTVPTVEFNQALELVGFSQGINDSRVFLNSTLFELLNGELRLVATDAHRLSRVVLSNELFQDQLCSTIVPRATIAEISKLTKKTTVEMVTMQVVPGQVVFNIGNIEVISKLIEGRYPDYGRVIPISNEYVCTVLAKDLADAVKRVVVIGSDKLHTITFSFEENRLVLTVKNDAQELSVDEVAVAYSGPNIVMNFNVRYWLELLPRVEGNVTIALQSPDRAALVGVDNNKNFTHVIMPLRG